MQPASRPGALYALRTAWRLVLAGMQRWCERPCTENLSDLWRLSSRIKARREVLWRCLPDAVVTDKREGSNTARIIPNEPLQAQDLTAGLEVLAVTTKPGPVGAPRSPDRENPNFGVERQETWA